MRLLSSSRSRRTTASGRGFTLIELLVVMVIIAILAFLATSAVQKVGEQSKRVACLSNLRQWGSALQLYQGENTGQFPRRGQGVQLVGQFNRPQDWFNALPPYMDMEPLSQMMSEGHAPKPGDHSVFACPAALTGQSGANVFLSYGMNMYLSQWDQPNPDNLSDIQHPEELAFMADSPGGYASTIPSAAGYSVSARHNGHACVVFCDGHAVAFPGDYLGCGSGAKTQPDVRWQNIPGSPTSIK